MHHFLLSGPESFLPFSHFGALEEVPFTYDAFLKRWLSHVNTEQLKWFDRHGLIPVFEISSSRSFVVPTPLSVPNPSPSQRKRGAGTIVSATMERHVMPPPLLPDHHRVHHIWVWSFHGLVSVSLLSHLDPAYVSGVPREVIESFVQACESFLKQAATAEMEHASVGVSSSSSSSSSSSFQTGEATLPLFVTPLGPWVSAKEREISCRGVLTALLGTASPQSLSGMWGTDIVDGTDPTYPPTNGVRPTDDSERFDQVTEYLNDPRTPPASEPALDGVIAHICASPGLPCLVLVPHPKPAEGCVRLLETSLEAEHSYSYELQTVLRQRIHDLTRACLSDAEPCPQGEADAPSEYDVTTLDLAHVLPVLAPLLQINDAEKVAGTFTNGQKEDVYRLLREAPPPEARSLQLVGITPLVLSRLLEGLTSTSCTKVLQRTLWSPYVFFPLTQPSVREAWAQSLFIPGMEVRGEEEADSTVSGSSVLLSASQLSRASKGLLRTALRDMGSTCWGEPDATLSLLELADPALGVSLDAFHVPYACATFRGRTPDEEAIWGAPDTYPPVLSVLCGEEARSQLVSPWSAAPALAEMVLQRAEDEHRRQKEKEKEKEKEKKETENMSPFSASVSGDRLHVVPPPPVILWRPREVSKPGNQPKDFFSSYYFQSSQLRCMTGICLYGRSTMHWITSPIVRGDFVL